MNKYSLQTTILSYISISAIFIAFMLAYFIVTDHKRSLEENLLNKMHLSAHYLVEYDLYKYDSTELKKRYQELLQNYHQSDIEVLDKISIIQTKVPPKEGEYYLSVYEQLAPEHYLVLVSDEKYIDVEIRMLLLELIVWLLFFLCVVILFFHLLLKRLLYPLKCLVNYCHMSSHSQEDLMICSGTYEIDALRDAILKLQQKNQLLCKEKQDIFREAAHEIKTPIAILKARLDLFTKSDMNKDEFLKQSKQDISTISNKLRELIFLKAIEWDLQQAKEHVPMQLQCKMMQELFKPILAKKNVNMVSNLQEDFSLYIHKEAIGRVMQAIFENIFMHTKNGTTIYNYIDAQKYQLKIVNEVGEESDEVLFSSHIGSKLIQRLSGKLEYSYEAYEDGKLFYTIITFKGQGI